jgi:integrase
LVFHSLRHTVVTFLMQANIPEPIVKAIVGHAQAGVTQQNYFKEGYTLRQLSDALERLHWPEP